MGDEKRGDKKLRLNVSKKRYLEDFRMGELEDELKKREKNRKHDELEEVIETARLYEDFIGNISLSHDGHGAELQISFKW